MTGTPLTRRLQSDHQKVLRLVNGSGGSITLISTCGSPPTSYLLEYHCPSLVKIGTEPKIINGNYRVEIRLGASYPFDKPDARMMTPVFNPHVFSNLAICLGGIWSPAETLDTIILKIGALLQLDPRVLDPHSAANQEANNWVLSHRQRLPVGNITFFSTLENNSSPEPRIHWS